MRKDNYIRPQKKKDKTFYYNKYVIRENVDFVEIGTRQGVVALINLNVHLSLCGKKLKRKKLSILLTLHTEKEEMKKMHKTEVKA